MNKVTTIWLVAILACGVGHAFALNNNVGCAAGSPGAPIKIEIFSDFECPSCRTFYLETIRPVIDNYARLNRVLVVYYDYPLLQHKYAREAARFAIAARRLGLEQWLKVSDALYGQQAQWSETGKVDWVVAQVLSPEDLVSLKKLMAGPEIDQEIDRAVMLANSRGVTSTPTFFVTTNGREQRVVGGVSYQVMKSHLDRNLK
jgi:protein-disulfide isomerase